MHIQENGTFCSNYQVENVWSKNGRYYQCIPNGTFNQKLYKDGDWHAMLGPPDYSNLFICGILILMD